MDASPGQEASIVPGRRCGSCTLCCKLLAVQEIDKPAATVCAHCEMGHGCRIYDARPKQCRLFNCHFLTNAQLREVWRPSKSRMVIVVSANGQRIGVNVDPERPGAWRRKPFYSTLKVWARKALERPDEIGQVFVNIGKQTIVIFPDRDVDLGTVENDELVITEARKGPYGLTLEAFKIKRDDARASFMLGRIQESVPVPIFQ